MKDQPVVLEWHLRVGRALASEQFLGDEVEVEDYAPIYAELIAAADPANWVCEWKKNTADKPTTWSSACESCCSFEWPIFETWRFCPYCGKRIKEEK